MSYAAKLSVSLVVVWVAVIAFIIRSDRNQPRYDTCMIEREYATGSFVMVVDVENRVKVQTLKCDNGTWIKQSQKVDK